MAHNGGTICGQVYTSNWFDGPAGLWVSIESLSLGGERFTYMPKRPEAQTTEGGHFGIGFSWHPQHVGKIDQPLIARISVQDASSYRGSARAKVGLYVSLGKIWGGMGGPSYSRQIKDVINSWVDVHTTIRKVPVPQILKQTGWMSPEAYGMLGYVKIRMEKS